MTSSLPLSEVFRPRCLAEVVGQDDAVAKLARQANRGFGGRVVHFTGKPGSGKTSLSRVIARLHAGVIGAVVEYKTAEKCDARELELAYRDAAFAGKADPPIPFAVIINECHRLSASAIGYILGATDPVLPNMLWIFTTTIEAQATLFADKTDADPFMSRCHLKIKLSQRQGVDRLAVYMTGRLRGAGMLNGHPDEYYADKIERALKDRQNDMRAVWNVIESGDLFDLD